MPGLAREVEFVAPVFEPDGRDAFVRAPGGCGASRSRVARGRPCSAALRIARAAPSSCRVSRRIATARTPPERARVHRRRDARDSQLRDARANGATATFRRRWKRGRYRHNRAESTRLDDTS